MNKKLVTVFAILVAMAQASKDDISLKMRQLKKAPDGLFHIGDDGVVRSYDGSGKVLDIVRLSNAELLSGGVDFGKDTAEKDHLTQVWTGVDGNQVTDAQAWNPPKNLLPLKFGDSEEWKAQKAKQAVTTRNDKVGMLGKRQQCPSTACDNNDDCLSDGCTGCSIPDLVITGSCV